MTPQQADMLLQEIGLFEVKSVPQHYEKSVQLLGEESMLELCNHLNGEFDFSEEYLQEKCGEDPYFSVIHSTKYNIFKEELVWLDKVLPENALVFDLGCNTGHMTALCARMRKSCRFVGYDTIDLTLKKADQIKSALGLDNLSFKNCDFMSLNTAPKPDGIMSLQAIGNYLDDPENIAKICNLTDTKAFIILVEAFRRQKELKSILKAFEKYGFYLTIFDRIACGDHRERKTMPAILLARGFDVSTRIDIKSIKL
jgi:SAM-dependent methyltransferase